MIVPAMVWTALTAAWVPKCPVSTPCANPCTCSCEARSCRNRSPRRRFAVGTHHAATMAIAARMPASRSFRQEAGYRANQICANPPSTQISLPFTKLESPEARNRAVVAISSELPNSLRGMADRKFSFIASGAFARALVAIGPGLSTFTRILRSASSTAHDRANDRSAALLPA